MPIARLDSRAVIAITGPDARPFLHNLLTQDVETLAPGELRFGALLTPQGRLIVDVMIWGCEDGVWLDVPAEAREGLIQRLTLYRLRAQVEVAAVESAVFASWNEAEAGFIADPRQPGLGGRALDLAGQATASEADWHRHRMAQGVPEPALDTVPDKTYPIEANLDLLNGIDFHKGCFVGQETTSRMKRRGTIKTRILPFTYQGQAPAVGAEVLNGDLRAGEVTRAEGGQGMAMIRLDRIDGDLSVEGQPIIVTRPDWVPAFEA